MAGFPGSRPKAYMLLSSDPTYTTPLTTESSISENTTQYSAVATHPFQVKIAGSDGAFIC